MTESYDPYENTKAEKWMEQLKMSLSWISRFTASRMRRESGQDGGNLQQAKATFKLWYENAGTGSWTPKPYPGKLQTNPAVGNHYVE